MRIPRMPAFRHFCSPCDTCGSTGVREIAPNVEVECSVCEGQAKPCACRESWEDEGERRVDAMRDGGYERE